MEREIYFKAQRVDNGQWRYGFLLKGKNLDYYIVSEFEPTLIEVHEETVCQFTGCFDKNGTKIFEGDSLLTDNDKNDIRLIEDMRFDIAYYGVQEDPERFEVIGNIND
jgi:hypothetical protein